MYNHASQDYTCPICLGIKGIENDKTLIKKEDVVYQDELVTAFINSFWIKNNPGHVIVVPNEHYENIYDLPDELGAHIHKIAKKIALAMKQAYKCDGITTLQNNEPAGNQHAFHYHFHIFPRYDHDDLHANMMDKQLADPVERAKYASQLVSELN
jgi:histidine triad (HIT) family protein